MKQRSQIKSLSSVLGVGTWGVAQGEESDVATNETGQLPMPSLNETGLPCGSQAAVEFSHNIAGVPRPTTPGTCTDAFLAELTRRGLTYRTFCPNCTGEIPASCNRDAQIAATRREAVRLQGEAAVAAQEAAAKAAADAQVAASQAKEQSPVSEQDLSGSSISAAFSSAAARAATAAAKAKADTASAFGHAASKAAQMAASSEKKKQETVDVNFPSYSQSAAQDAVDANIPNYSPNGSGMDQRTFLDMTPEEKTEYCKGVCKKAFAGHQDQIDACGQRCVDKFGGTATAQKEYSGGSGIALVAGLGVLAVVGWFVFGKKG